MGKVARTKSGIMEVTGERMLVEYRVVGGRTVVHTVRRDDELPNLAVAETFGGFLFRCVPGCINRDALKDVEESQDDGSQD